jgi:hypothetical protein
MKVTDYKVISDYAYKEFEAQVNDHIKQGWQPHGSLVIINRNGFHEMSQAMVKFAE